MNFIVLPYNVQVHSMFGTTEKNRSGPQRRKFPPCLPKFTPLPKRFFSQDNPKDSICPVSLCIIRMKQLYLVRIFSKASIRDVSFKAVL